MDPLKPGTTALVVAACALSSHAEAQAVGRFRLAWMRDQGAEACPSGPAIAAEVARRLGRNPFVETDGPSIEAAVRRDGPRWIARLVVRDAADALVGVREFTSEAADCAAIASAVTLGVALSIDPEAALRPAPPVAAPVTAPVAPPVAAPEAPPVVAPVTPPRALRVRPDDGSMRGASLSLHAAGSIGLLPTFGPGVDVTADGPLVGRLRWGVGLMFLPEVITRTQSASVAFGLTAGSLSSCFLVWRSRGASLGGCLGVLVGAVHAVVLSGTPSAPGEQPWAAASAGARFRGRLAGPLWAEVGLEGVAPFVRHRFYSGESGATVFQQPPVAGVAFAGLSLQFR